MPDTLPSDRDWRGHWDGGAPLPQGALAQVGRTVGGKPIDPAQMDRLVAAIEAALDLRADDVLADLCCGNGLVSVRLARRCAAVVGVDYSRDLIAVALADYGAPNISYLQRGAQEIGPDDFPAPGLNKVVMNQGLQYFDEAMLRDLLVNIDACAGRGMALFFTDIPDVALIRAFYDTPARWAEYERRRAAGEEALGTWWSRDHLGGVLADHGYGVEFRVDPGRFTAHYRFDVLATKG
ncbi:class I SAM-dependent methyltransferase [Phenylobacterium sp.]|uniref:class I SAM-dependent methyltransferase n=1 Tax=Phenylobacterium sp. TaxID=1871053 RepID=UPI0030F48659